MGQKLVFLIKLVDFLPPELPLRYVIKSCFCNKPVLLKILYLILKLYWWPRNCPRPTPEAKLILFVGMIFGLKSITIIYKIFKLKKIAKILVFCGENGKQSENCANS